MSPIAGIAHNTRKYGIIILTLLAVACSAFQTGNHAVELVRTTTVAGFGRELSEPFGLAIREGTLYVSDGDAGKILKVSTSGESSVFAQGLQTPSAIAFDSAGDLIVADTGDNTIKRIDAAGAVSIVAGVPGRRGDADGAAASATFNGPIGLAVGTGDRIYVADTYNDRIRFIENATVRTVAGSSRGFADGPAADAKFDTPTGLVELRNGNVLVCDSQNSRLRIVEPNGNTSTLAGSGEDRIVDGFFDAAQLDEPTAVTLGEGGDVYITDGSSIRVIRDAAFPVVATISGERRGFVDGNVRSARFNRPSGIAYDRELGLFVADSDNQSVRLIGPGSLGRAVTDEDKNKLRYSAEEFRGLQPARWPFEPPKAVREIAGTLGEIRGSVGPDSGETRFHNGLDIAGGYGETTRFVRGEKVLLPAAAENFGTSRELIRLPTLGYIHIRIGRSASDAIYDDPRFQFTRDGGGKVIDVRAPRGSVFAAGEMLGTLNAMNHAHLVAGRSGAEINAIAGLDLPGVSDSIAPVIENVAVYDENWRKNETLAPSNRITVTSRSRVVVRSYDRVDGNAERRRLGVYKLGYRLTRTGTESGPVAWNIQFDRMPQPDVGKFVYAPGSQSGATGVTVFNYIVTNRVNGDHAEEGFIDPASLENGEYTLEVFAADYFGNTRSKTLAIEVSK